jgi:hypothetical protein
MGRQRSDELAGQKTKHGAIGYRLGRGRDTQIRPTPIAPPLLNVHRLTRILCPDTPPDPIRRLGFVRDQRRADFGQTLGVAHKFGHRRPVRGRRFRLDGVTPNNRRGAFRFCRQAPRHPWSVAPHTGRTRPENARGLRRSCCACPDSGRDPDHVLAIPQGQDVQKRPSAANSMDQRTERDLKPGSDVVRWLAAYSTSG